MFPFYQVQSEFLLMKSHQVLYHVSIILDRFLQRYINRIRRTTLYNITCFHQFSINRIVLYDYLLTKQLCYFVKQIQGKNFHKDKRQNTPDNFRNYRFPDTIRFCHFSHPTFICKVIYNAPATCFSTVIGSRNPQCIH